MRRQLWCDWSGGKLERGKDVHHRDGSKANICLANLRKVKRSARPQMAPIRPLPECLQKDAKGVSSARSKKTS